MKIIAALLAAAAVVPVAQASATVFTVGGGTITPGSAQTFSLNNTETATGPFTDYYQFTINGSALASSGFQTTRLDSVSNIDFTSATLYSGLYSGVGTGTTLATFTPTGEDPQGQETQALGGRPLAAGSYTIAIAGNTTAASASYQGSLTLAATPVSNVPEAATWALMLGGFGLAGGVMRTSRKRDTFAA